MTPSFGPPAELAELADEYEVLGELGRGGSAIVYRARDRALGRDVAIKVVHPRPTSPDDDPVARLAREARTVAQLHHPGIVSVYAVRRLHAGGLTLVMQFVPGATLKASIQRGGPFGPARAETILRDVAQALAYAHARRVVHRDVKPENIFLDAESGRALLADFGIARSNEADSLTMTGTAIGTPFYMSPEQVDGMPVDGRSDVYSLGLVAWEMLTGLRPWDGESLYHVIYKQKHDELPPIEATRRDVPRRLQYIVDRMLQKHPAARWAGADGLLAQLDCSILPADYAQWQAALPGRVARHRAVSSLQPRAEVNAAHVTAAGAATVQFAATRTRSSDAKTSVGNQGAVARMPLSGFAPDGDSSSSPVFALSESPPPAATAANATDDPAQPAYETIAPSWAYLDPHAPRSITWMWVRRTLAGSAILVALVGIGSSAVGSHVVPVVPTLLSALAELRFGRPHAAPRARVAVSRWVARGSQSDAPTAIDPNEPDLTGTDPVTVGARHTCNVTLAGSAQCWGANDDAQLGDGRGVTGSSRPRAVVGVMTYMAVSAGASHTCGVTQPGDVYCWGMNNRGQLGDGTTIRRSAPVRVGGAGTYRSVRGGGGHTCALDVEGPVRCWGDNTSGQLGNGTRTSALLPTLVRLPAGVAAVAIATGNEHSCALMSDDRVLCWGSNSDGQLGVPDERIGAEPREVPGVRASAIGAGDAHTCVVLRTGPVRCWGRDDAGQLGVSNASVGAPGRLTVVPGGEDVRTVAAGASHTCALTRGGWVWCWGGSRAGLRQSPMRLGGGPYVSLAAGGDQSCAMPRGRVAECWRRVGVGAQQTWLRAESHAERQARGGSALRIRQLEQHRASGGRVPHM